MGICISRQKLSLAKVTESVGAKEAKQEEDGRVVVRVARVYDGDTFYVRRFRVNAQTGQETDIVPGKDGEEAVRVAGIDTPEVKAQPGETAECAAKHKRAGAIVRDDVKALVLGKEVVLTNIYKTDRKTGEQVRRREKWGRNLARVQVIQNNSALPLDLSDYLLRKGYALPYEDGGTKPVWSDEQLDHIIKTCATQGS